MRCVGHGSVHPLNIQARKSSSPVNTSVSNPINLRAVRWHPWIYRTHYEPCLLTISLGLKSSLCFGTSLSLYLRPFLFPPKRSAGSGWIEVSLSTIGVRTAGALVTRRCCAGWERLTSAVGVGKKPRPLPALCVVGLGPVDGLCAKGLKLVLLPCHPCLRPAEVDQRALKPGHHVSGYQLVAV